MTEKGHKEQNHIKQREWLQRQQQVKYANTFLQNATIWPVITDLVELRMSILPSAGKAKEKLNLCSNTLPQCTIQHNQTKNI
jgi:hypothetical protein